MYQYSQSGFVAPPRLLGLGLRPLSLGHVDALHALGIDVLADLALDELAIALLVCSAHPQALRSGHGRRWLLLLAWLLGMRIGRLKPQAVRAAISRWQEYVKFFAACPPRWADKEKTVCRVPWHLAIFAAIQRETNIGPAECWAMPVREAAELCAAISVANGDTSLMSAEEQAFEDRVEDYTRKQGTGE